MFGEERKKEILDILNLKGNVKVSELSKHYNVSEVTIRKDLQELEEAGLIERVHGGAVVPQKAKYEPTFTEKTDKYIDEKIAIGKAAASLIKEGDTIALDAGTTTLQLAKNISHENLTVITNSLDIAEELADRKNMEVIVIGGSLRCETRALVGPVSNMALENFNVDKAFIGVNGISIKKGATTPDVTEAHTKKALIECSKETIILCDHSKFDFVSFSKIVDMNEIDCIVTDDGAEEDTIKAFSEKGFKIIIARS